MSFVHVLQDITENVHDVHNFFWLSIYPYCLDFPFTIKFGSFLSAQWLSRRLNLSRGKLL